METGCILVETGRDRPGCGNRHVDEIDTFCAGASAIKADLSVTQQTGAVVEDRTLVVIMSPFSEN